MVLNDLQIICKYRYALRGGDVHSPLYNDLYMSVTNACINVPVLSDLSLSVTDTCMSVTDTCMSVTGTCMSVTDTCFNAHEVTLETAYIPREENKLF